METNPHAGYRGRAWWEAPEYQAIRNKTEAREQKKEKEVLDARQAEVEKVAREWAKREFFRKSLDGAVDKDVTEEAYIESVWERALFEGDITYRKSIGEITDEEAELADFKAKQERKQQNMLKKAKAELEDVLGEKLDDDNVDDDEE